MPVKDPLDTSEELLSHCILCRSDNVKLTSKIKTSDICQLYMAYLSVDIYREFKELEWLNYVECLQCGLKFFLPTVTGSANFYERLSQASGENYYLKNKSEYSLAGNFIHEHDTVLDIGAGRGHFSKYVKGSFAGLEFNESAISTAKENGIMLYNESIEEHATKNHHSYSVITAFQVLEHMSRPDLFIESCLKALRPGGLLILSVPSEDSYISLQENAVMNMPPHHLTRWTDVCLRNMSEIFGLSCVCLEHEILSSVHHMPYLQTIALQTIRSFLGIQPDSIIDRSLKTSAITRMSRYLSPFYAKIFLKRELLPHGHSVTAIFRKE